MKFQPSAFSLAEGCYYGKPAHHIETSILKMASNQQNATPQSGVTVQDALGLITIYPRPDVPASFPLPITHHSQPPSIPPFLSRLQSASTTAFSIQEHLTIRNWQCKHITKINRITVYPFIYKRVNRYIIVLLIFNSFVANLNYLLYNISNSRKWGDSIV